MPTPQLTASALHTESTHLRYTGDTREIEGRSRGDTDALHTESTHVDSSSATVDTSGTPAVSMLNASRHQHATVLVACATHGAWAGSAVH